jgi:hypothetical protein
VNTKEVLTGYDVGVGVAVGVGVGVVVGVGVGVGKLHPVHPDINSIISTTTLFGDPPTLSVYVTHCIWSELKSLNVTTNVVPVVICAPLNNKLSDT